MQASFIAVLITAIIIAIFAVLNAEPVSVNLFFARFQLSQAVVILISFAIGALSMFILNMVQAMKFKKQIKQLNKQLTDAGKTIEQKQQDAERAQQEKAEAILANQSAATPVTEGMFSEENNDAVNAAEAEFKQTLEQNQGEQ